MTATYSDGQEPFAGGQNQADRTSTAGAVQDGPSVRAETASFASQAKERAVQALEDRKSGMTQAMSGFAEAIRNARDELGRQEQTMAARLVGEAADGLEGFSRAMSERRPDELLNGLRDFGRAHPAAFLAGAVFAGVALGRFARSSSPDTQPMSGSYHEGQGSAGAGASPLAAAADERDSGYQVSGIGDEAPATAGLGAGLVSGLPGDEELLGETVQEQTTVSQGGTTPSGGASSGSTGG